MTQTRSEADVTVETVTGSLEHLILSPDQTFESIEQACREAADYDLAAVSLPPYAVPWATRLLRGTGVTVCGAVGMPFGHSGRRAKCDEAGASIEAGAAEVDMIINLVAMKSGRYGDVESEIAAVRRLASGITLKVTLECCYLTDAEEVRAARLAVDTGADVVKTHTGFGTGDVRVHDVRLLKRAAAGEAQVEAAGGVTRFKKVLALLETGASRVAVDTPLDILEDFYQWETA